MDKNNQIAKNFNDLKNQVTQSYQYLEGDEQGLKDSSMDLEVELYNLQTIAKQFKSGVIGLEQFKENLGNIIVKEFCQLIVVDVAGQEIPDEQKLMICYLYVNSLSEDELKELAVDFYKTLSGARTIVHHLLNPNVDVFVLGQSMMPSALTVFDEPKTPPQKM